MKITAAQYAEVLLEVTDGLSGKNLDLVIKDFAAVLHERHELSRYREIIRAFENAWRKKYGAATVQMTTAYEMSAKMKKALAEIAPHAEIKTEVDPKIVGGAILKIDDRLYDGSVAGLLEQMAQNLNQ